MPVNSSRGAIAVKALGFTTGAPKDYYFIAQVTSSTVPATCCAYKNGNYIANYATNGSVNSYEYSGTMSFQSGVTYGVATFPEPIATAGDDGYQYLTGPNTILKQDTSGVAWAYRYSLYGLSGSTWTPTSVATSGSDTYFLTSGYDATSTNIQSILYKLNSAGAVQYGKQFTLSGVSGDIAYGLSIAGSYMSFCGDSSAARSYVALVDLSFSTVFVRDVSSISGIAGRYTACDAAGNVYFGYLDGSLVFKIVKLNSSGSVQWNKSYNIPSGVSRSVALKLYAGYLWVATTEGSSSTTYLIKINAATGDVVFARTLSHTTSTAGPFTQISVVGTSMAVSVRDAGVFARLPTNGTGTGTYSVGGNNITYAVASITASTATDTFSSKSLSVTNVTPTSSAQTTTTFVAPSIAVTQV